ncbi:unnamed protein product [Paramecium pentaurelia]|uniref:Uncharacterized protein n=1 Tax=Paramecium pentaurelia TaxID=43138 RepID=A0A8S1UTI0_9CILI|nr:unnamed protein product [Paramecium pentaurelia]
MSNIIQFQKLLFVTTFLFYGVLTNKYKKISLNNSQRKTKGIYISPFWLDQLQYTVEHSSSIDSNLQPLCLSSFPHRLFLEKLLAPMMHKSFCPHSDPYRADFKASNKDCIFDLDLLFIPVPDDSRTTEQDM